MCENVWIAIVAAVLGGGGLGAAVVNALANRKKIQADCVATLSQAYEIRRSDWSSDVCSSDLFPVTIAVKF